MRERERVRERERERERGTDRDGEEKGVRGRRLRLIHTFFIASRHLATIYVGSSSQAHPIYAITFTFQPDNLNLQPLSH